MRLTNSINLLPFLSLLASSVSASRVSTEELQNRLRLAPNAASRIKILDKDEDFFFDFLNPPGGEGETIGRGGRTVGASGTTFPALIGTGMAMTLGFLGPCGINTPHTHPRATEFNMVVAGSAGLRSGVITENGARFIINNVPLGAAAIFPQGAIHFEQNLGCDPAIFVAAFNSEDPGVLQIADRFFDISDDFVSAALGGIPVQEFKDIEIPANVALGTDECLQRCGIDRATFSFNGSFPFNWNATSALLSNSREPGSGNRSPNNTGAIVAAAEVPDASSEMWQQVPFSANPLRGALIGLAAASGVLLLLLIAAAVRLFTRPKHAHQPLSDSEDRQSLVTRRGHIRKLSAGVVGYGEGGSGYVGGTEKSYRDPYAPAGSRVTSPLTPPKEV